MGPVFTKHASTEIASDVFSWSLSKTMGRGDFSSSGGVRGPSDDTALLDLGLVGE
jgi:hypothetical protein